MGKAGYILICYYAPSHGLLNRRQKALPMTYTRHIPSPPLDAYIDDLYYLDGAAPYTRLKVLPMPSLHLMVNLGDAFRVHGAGRAESCTESWWVGLWSTYHTVEWPPNVRMFGVHFKPGGVYPFLRLPLSELHNQVVSLEIIWGKYAAEIRERLYAAPTPQTAFALFEQLLLARLRETLHGLDAVQYAIAEIERHHGALSIRTLSDRIGISQNHLGTQFKRMVGVPPKELARFYRFAQVLRSIDPNHPVDWTLIAHQSCFYDQSHFNKDFAAFTGHNPTDYLALRRRLHHPEHIQNLGQLPID
jgi:AraC-like DNA-binding protein